MHITVVGGTNIDFVAKCAGEFKMFDSNIATIKTSHGGVARNILHNCALLGLDCSFYSAVGDDEYGKAILKKLSSLGVDISGVKIYDGLSTGVYISFMNNKSDMVCAVNDMKVSDRITPESLDALEFKDGIIAFDANLTEEALEYLIDKKQIKFAEPVSVAKGMKLKPYLKHIDIIKPNVYEAESLSGIKIECENDIIKAGEELIKEGVKKVFITAGEDGVYAFSDNDYFRFKPKKVSPLNATGAGDAFSGGILYSVSFGYDLKKTCYFASECAVNAILCEETVNENLNSENILRKIKEL